MKILQLSPQFPFPEDEGGKIGIASTFKQLAKKADVTFFCFSSDKISSENIKKAEKYGKVLIFPHSTKNTPIRILLSLVREKPLYLLKHINGEILKFLSDLVVKEKFDVIHADHTAMAPLAIELARKYNLPVGLRLHNVEHLIWQRYADVLHSRNPKKWYIQSQANKLKKYEAELLAKFDVCFPITDNDVRIAKNISPSANLVVAGPGINLEQWQPDASERVPNSLIHATTYNWVHNVDAVRWFINEVMVSLNRQNSEIRFQILGKNPPEDFYGYAGIGVEVLGFVPSVKPYLSSAGIYAAPLFVGGGIRIKILEAMAMELPVVASPVSAEGIHAGREEGLIIAESSEDFIKEILNLVNNPVLSQKLGKNARKYVLENYTWEKSIGIIYNTYKHLTENK